MARRAVPHTCNATCTIVTRVARAGVRPLSAPSLHASGAAPNFRPPAALHSDLCNGPRTIGARPCTAPNRPCTTLPCTTCPCTNVPCTTLHQCFPHFLHFLQLHRRPTVPTLGKRCTLRAAWNCTGGGCKMLGFKVSNCKTHDAAWQLHFVQQQERQQQQDHQQLQKHQHHQLNKHVRELKATAERKARMPRAAKSRNCYGGEGVEGVGG